MDIGMIYSGLVCLYQVRCYSRLSKSDCKGGEIGHRYITCC